MAYSGENREIRRTTVVLCDRRSGRERVVRRGRLDQEAKQGVAYEGASAAGRRLVWVEERWWRGRARAVLVEARATDRLVVRSKELGRRPISTGLGELDVVVTADGTVATFAGDDALRLVVRRGGRELRELDRGAFGYLGLEDGRTVRVTAYVNGIAERRYHDLGPLPRGETGCSRRERFERVLLTDTVEVTEAVYPHGLSYTYTVRACLRATGRDDVVGHGESSFGDSTSVGVPATDGDWIALQRSTQTRYYGCERTSLSTLNLRTGARGPAASVEPCDGLRTDEPAVITPVGVLAWVARRDDAWTIRTALRDNDPLDTGPPGSITNLRAAGSTLRWDNAGQPRSAELEPAS